MLFPGQLVPTHGLGAQETPTPLKVWPEPQFAVNVQARVVLSQHAPSCGHGFGVQEPPAPSQLPDAQPAWVRTKHSPVPLLQHAPVGGQGLGEQVDPMPWNIPEQPSSVCKAHSPSSALQHAPGAWGVTVSVKSLAAPPLPAPRATRTITGIPAGRLGESNRERLPQFGSLSLHEFDEVPTRLLLVAGHPV